MLCISVVKCHWKLVSKPHHYTVLTVYLVTNCSEMLLEIHFSVNGHTKQFHGILDWKRECVISCSQDHRLMLVWCLCIRPLVFHVSITCTSFFFLGLICQGQYLQVLCLFHKVLPQQRHMDLNFQLLPHQVLSNLQPRHPSVS